MVSKKIDGIDYLDKIEKLNTKFNDLDKVRNFTDDNTREFRKAIQKIDSEIFSPMKNVIRDGEKALLVECYTISEQMMKSTIYQLLNFDISEKSDYQKFLNHKISPEKFSPNAKTSEISKLFKQYGFSPLFLTNLSLYDSMIDARHKYAHKGTYQFSYSDIPKLVEILKYLEFEYRMFLAKNEWGTFQNLFNSCLKNGEKSVQSQQNYEDDINNLKRLSSKIIEIVRVEENILTQKFQVILNAVNSDEKYVEVCKKIKNLKNEVQEIYKI
jgi:hypothetical protein